MKDKKKHPNLRPPWKPGDPSPNPSGRPKLSDAERKLRRSTKEQIKEIGDIIINGSRVELEHILDNPGEYSELQYQIACALKVSAEKGDWFTVDKILDRLIGKVQEDVAISLPRPTVIDFGEGREIILGAKKGDDE